jgi:serine/threonine-protein kinase
MKTVHTLGKYELLGKIGAGGMAEVYKARLTGVEGFQKVVVVKRILPGYARNMSFIRMLVEEAKLTSVLQHPNIVQIFELESDQAQFYMVMEYVEGKDLLKILARCAEQKRRPPLELVCHIIAEVCKGLNYAHNAKDMHGKALNIIHRDVSPSNIIVSNDGHVKVMDFGVAKARNQESGGSRHVLRGKLGYMSPEQVRAEDIDKRSDIFSLGIVFFEALTLKRLFLGKTDLETLINIRDANIEKKLLKHAWIPDSLKDILRKALAPNPDERYASAEALQGDIEDFLYRSGHRVKPSHLQDLLGSLFAGDAPMPDQLEMGDDPEPEVGVSDNPAEKTNSARPSPMQDLLETDNSSGTFEMGPGSDSTGGLLVGEGSRQETTGHSIGLERSPGELTEPEPPQRFQTGSKSEERARAELEREDAESLKNFTRKEETSPDIGDEYTEVKALKGHTYRLQNTQGYIFGPVDFNELMNMVQIGAISEEEMVSIDGSEWKRVRDITAVRQISPQRAIQAKGLKPIYSGTMQRSMLPRIFYQLASRRISGKLRFFEGSRQKEFFFRKGKVVHIASNLKQELVGNFLMRRGAVTQDQMDRALEKAKGFGGRIGDALVSLGIILPYQLFELLDLQYREKFLQLFEWTGGGYEFFEGIPSPVEMAPQDSTVYQFIMDGMRRFAEDRELFMYLQPYRNMRLQLTQSRHLKRDQLPLNTREGRLVARLDKGGILGSVEHEYEKEMENLRVFRILVLVLHQTELLEFK